MLTRKILFWGKTCVLACDGRCDKAWGLEGRPRVQVAEGDEEDFAWKSDHELGVAPENPGTYEGGHAKPLKDEKLDSKWCARACERSAVVSPGDEIILRDWRTRRYNRSPHVREDPEIPKSRPEAITGNERTLAVLAEIVVQLHPFTIEERLQILVPMIMAQVNTSPDSVPVGTHLVEPSP